MPAQANDPALSLADYLYIEENFSEAATEYQRYLFFNPAGEQAGYAYRQMALAFRELGQWDKASDAYRNAVQAAENDSLRNELRVDLALILIAGGNYSGAELELVRVSHFCPYPNIKKRASFFLGVSCIYNYKWHEAIKALQVYQSGFAAEKGIDSILGAAQNLKYKSPRRARLYSTFVPGLGQMYAGAWKNGLNAMALNAATGYWFVDGLQNGSLADIATGYFLIFFRYYRGNRNNAYNLALRYNDDLNQRQARHALDYLYRTAGD